MLDDERRDLELRLALLELVQAALARRQEVVETVWQSHDREDAARRLRVLLDIRDDTPPEVVLDLQLHRMTSRRREDLAREVAELRQELGLG